MEMIRIYNYHTNEVLEKTFANPADADNYERFHLGRDLDEEFYQIKI